MTLFRQVPCLQLLRLLAEAVVLSALWLRFQFLLFTPLPQAVRSVPQRDWLRLDLMNLPPVVSLLRLRPARRGLLFRQH